METLIGRTAAQGLLLRRSKGRYGDRRSKSFQTVLGPMRLERAYYHRAICGEGSGPRDRALGMTGLSSPQPPPDALSPVPPARTAHFFRSRRGRLQSCYRRQTQTGRHALDRSGANAIIALRPCILTADSCLSDGGVNFRIQSWLVEIFRRIVRTALVTGGAGFIGSHLVDELLRERWRVTVADNIDPFYDAALKRKNISEHLDHPSYRFVHIDIRDRVQMEAALPGPFDAIVHLAARPGVMPSIAEPALYNDVNTGGTQAVLDFARTRGIPQFVFASSSSVYGANPAIPWREDRDAPAPVSPYAATKAASELMGHVYSRLFGMRFIALRLFTAYGPRQRPDLAIHKFARAMIEGAPLPIYGDLESLRDYTYVGDIVGGLLAAIDYTASSYEIINLGGGHPYRLGDIVRGLEQALSVRASLEFHRRPEGDLPRTSADISKARKLLGYEPATSLGAGLAKFAEWFEDQTAAAKALQTST